MGVLELGATRVPPSPGRETRMPVAMWIRHQYPRGISPQPPGSGELWQLRTQDPAGVPRPGVGRVTQQTSPCVGARNNQELVTCPRAQGHPPPAWSHACEVLASWHGWGSGQPGQRTQPPVPTSGRTVTSGRPKTQGRAHGEGSPSRGRLAQPQHAVWLLERSGSEPTSHVRSRSRGRIPGGPRPLTQLRQLGPPWQAGPDTQSLGPLRPTLQPPGAGPHLMLAPSRPACGPGPICRG